MHNVYRHWLVSGAKPTTAVAQLFGLVSCLLIGYSSMYEPCEECTQLWVMVVSCTNEERYACSNNIRWCRVWQREVFNLIRHHFLLNAYINQYFARFMQTAVSKSITPCLKVCIVIFEWKIFQKLAVRHFKNNTFENEAGI